MVFGYEPDVIEYGKPFINHMTFIEEYVLKYHDSVETIYMIGDNLSTDILGANMMAKNNKSIKGSPKWVSIAVKSGIFQDDQSDKSQIAKNAMLKPDHIVKDFEAAVKHIQNLEKTYIYHDGVKLNN